VNVAKSIVIWRFIFPSILQRAR